MAEGHSIQSISMSCHWPALPADDRYQNTGSKGDLDGTPSKSTAEGESRDTADCLRRAVEVTGWARTRRQFVAPCMQRMTVSVELCERWKLKQEREIKNSLWWALYINLWTVYFVVIEEPLGNLERGGVLCSEDAGASVVCCYLCIPWFLITDCPYHLVKLVQFRFRANVW